MWVAVYRKYALTVLVSALSVVSVIFTHTFAFVKNVQFGTEVMTKENSQFLLLLSEMPWLRLAWVNGLLGDDWPPFFPLALEREVEMAVEESVHYAAGADDEWWYERGFVSGGAGRMGADNRTFAVSLYHQEHCLLYLHGQLTKLTSKNRSPHHQHCLNYLRQQALCHSDHTLEPGDFARRDFGVDRVGETHMCRDFETAWDYNARNWLDWYYFLTETRLSNKSHFCHIIGRPLNHFH